MYTRFGVAISVAILLALPLSAAHAGLDDLLRSLSGDRSSSRSAPEPKSESNVTEWEAGAGLKDALSVGVRRAIKILGKEGGYLRDAQVRIPLPDSVQSVGNGLRAIGQDEIVDDFIATMNRAAERAVPKTVDIFTDTIKGMTLADARGVLQGPDDAATRYFQKQSTPQLVEAILPIVKDATEAVGVTSAYKQLTGEVSFLSVLSDDDALDLDRYITNRALDGLFLKLAAEEKRIRDNPWARSTDLLKKVFGSL
jgi:hypothetical protein